MIAVLLTAGALVAAPPEPAGQLPLRLQVGQEFLYRGHYTETTARPGARFSRICDLETYVCVLAQGPAAYDVAFLTVQRPQHTVAEEPIITARMELGKVDARGRIQFAGKRATWPRVPMESPPNLETLAFPARPASVTGGQKWDDTEDGQPVLTWTVSGVTRYESHQCLLLIASNQAGEWQREDRVWLRLDGGFAVRIERRIEQRTGGLSSQMVAELCSCNPFFMTGSEMIARRTEINQAQRFADMLDELMLPRGEADRSGYDALLTAIDAHVKNRVQTPYRDAILDLRRRALLAHSGERPPEPVVVRPTASGAAVDEGQPAPEFAVADLLTSETVRLSQLRGKPVILLMFRSSAATARHVLKYADETAKSCTGRVAVLALAVDGQPGEVVQLRSSLKAKVPVYGGAEAAKLFAGADMPKTVILDKFGTIRLIALGWGGEYPDWFGKEVEKLTGS